MNTSHMQVTHNESGQGKADSRFNGCNRSSTSSTETESTEHFSKSKRYIFNTVDSQSNQHLNDLKIGGDANNQLTKNTKDSNYGAPKKVIIDDKISIEHLLCHLYMMKPFSSQPDLFYHLMLKFQAIQKRQIPKDLIPFLNLQTDAIKLIPLKMNFGKLTKKVILRLQKTPDVFDNQPLIGNHCMMDFDTILLFSKMTIFKEMKWFPLPSQFYGKFLTEPNIDIPTIDDFLSRFTNYDPTQRNLHMYRVLEIPIFINEQVSVAFLCNFQSFAVQQHDEKAIIFYCNPMSNAIDHGLEKVGYNIRRFMIRYCFHHKITLKQVNLDGKDLPTIEVSFEKEINKFSCCYELMHIWLAMYSFLLCDKLTQEFFTNLEAEKINDTEKLMLPHGTRIFLSRSLANNSDRADVIRKDLLNAAKLIYATKQRLINNWQVPTCGARKFYIPTDISELDCFVFVANVSQEQSHNSEPASQEQITSSINKINIDPIN